MTFVLSLDLGTSSVRARVYEQSGEPVEGVEAQTPYEPTDGVLDPERLVVAARGAVEEALREFGRPVDAYATSCFRHSLLADRRVVPAPGDGACSNVGAGCVTPERAALMIGTSGAFQGAPGRRR